MDIPEDITRLIIDFVIYLNETIVKFKEFSISIVVNLIKF